MQIGVTLEVTPLINPDGLVVMEIHQRIDSFAGNVEIANVGQVPITTSKEASAKVSVRDHDTVILGGMIETDKNNSGCRMEGHTVAGVFVSACMRTVEELLVIGRR
jgi:type II secretory pathway component GspD/PulD (secretin)